MIWVWYKFKSRLFKRPLEIEKSTLDIEVNLYRFGEVFQIIGVCCVAIVEACIDVRSFVDRKNRSISELGIWRFWRSDCYQRAPHWLIIAVLKWKQIIIIVFDMKWLSCRIVGIRPCDRPVSFASQSQILVCLDYVFVVICYYARRLELLTSS